MKAISIAYHDVVDRLEQCESSGRRAPSYYTLERKTFQKHLEEIQGRSPSPLVTTIAAKNKWGAQVPVFLTFDDGAECAYTCVAGELEARGWRGHFFVTSSWIGKTGFMNASQIRELHGRGHVIGSHTHTHPERMSNLSLNDLVNEWTVSCGILEDILGEPVRTASVADGYYSRKVGVSAAQAGLEVLFNSEPVKSTGEEHGCLILGRYAVKAVTSPKGAGDLAEGAVLPCLGQMALWEAKKAAKAIGGQSYLSVRRVLLSARARL